MSSITSGQRADASERELVNTRSAHAPREVSEETDASVPPEVGIPRRLSPSALERYRACPRSFLLTDVERVAPKQDASPILASANAIHAALQRFYGLAVEDRSLDVLHRALRHVWPLCRTDAFTSREEEAEAGRSALALLTTYAEHFDLNVVPLAREEWVSCVLTSGFRVFGKVDRVDPGCRGGVEVVDYKTGRRALEPEDLPGEPAIQVYAIATYASFQLPVERVRVLYLRDGSEVSWEPEEEDVLAAGARLLELTERIAADRQFAAYPGDACRFCPVARRCPERGKVELSDLLIPEDIAF